MRPSLVEKAKQAPRYEPRHFPLSEQRPDYMARGEWLKALKEFEQAVEIMPDDLGHGKPSRSCAVGSTKRSLVCRPTMPGCSNRLPRW